MPKKKKVPLSDGEKAKVFKLRCWSKEGRDLTDAERDLCRDAYERDPDWYSKTEADVFNATVPFGSNARYPGS